MKLVFPNLLYKEKVIQFINEFYEYHSDINGSGGLENYLEKSTYEEWLKKVLADIDIANVSKPRVPALTYFYVREEDDKIIGMINIRLALNDFLKKEGGHIGYCVRPTERQKHYATDMLKDALKVCDTLGMQEVILTCDKTNIPSANVIKNCKGVLEAEFYSETFKDVIQKYIIER
ncbi:MAG: GNAT family N-acetyltransferase [Lachnospiraceae bacterium]|nr:GNAT family N-acetyltransferase [Lachnospiraceae bacterium]